LAELHTPLIERIDVPNHALGEDRVFVKGNELAQDFWRKPLGKYCVRWPIAFENSVRHEPIRCAFSFHFFAGFTERKSFALCKDICQKYVVMITKWSE